MDDDDWVGSNKVNYLKIIVPFCQPGFTYPSLSKMGTIYEARERY